MSTRIESDHVMIKASNKEVFDYLNDFNNIKELLPQDKISDWKSTKDDCSFKIQNAAKIPLIKEKTELDQKIHIVSGDDAPFPFTLVIHIEKNEGEEQSKAFMIFEGEINAFLKMMVVKPLTNLFNYMSHKLKEKLD
ncbi:MAG: hypothetical protein WDZ35_14315 [Crocinitomicaceae bacterium]